MECLGDSERKGEGVSLLLRARGSYKKGARVRVPEGDVPKERVR